ncbi:hypothetical protein BGS_0055 [Beggiatoa sp. SS]|nr:hypothetical protein BGS_0055 [Beggiatoa sp. SS]
MSQNWHKSAKEIQEARDCRCPKTPLVPKKWAEDLTL